MSFRMNEIPLKAQILPVTPYQQNCSIVWCRKTKKAAVIDPGGEVARLKGALESLGVSLEKVLLTHGHLDHASGASKLAREMGVPVEGPHEDDLFLLEALGRNASRPGFADAENCLPDRWLGHTPGHIVFFYRDAKVAFVSDVLFAGSVGRTDFPRGNHQQLVESITERLWPLGDDVRFVPGHGQTSTFGWERKCNPFVSDLALGRA